MGYLLGESNSRCQVDLIKLHQGRIRRWLPLPWCAFLWEDRAADGRDDGCSASFMQRLDVDLGVEPFSEKSFMGILAAPPEAAPPRNKALLRETIG